MLSDAIRLVAGEGPPIAERMAGTGLLATVVALGPALAAPARALLREIAASPASDRGEVLAAASPLQDGIHLRVGARSVEAGLAFVRSRLGFAAELLGGNPFERRP